MNEHLKEPLSPADDDCCGGGACAPCVWDHYYAERKKWRLQQVELKEKLAQEDAEKLSLSLYPIR
jgi:hypothetical protein